MNRVIVHYGGCTSPYTNEQWNFDLGTETWTMKYPHNLSAASNLPAGGCSRGLAFDSRRNRVWLNGNASNGGIGTGTSGLHYYDASTNVWTRAVENWGIRARFDGTTQAANGLAYDSVNDVLLSVGRVPAGVADVWVYTIATQTWNGRAYDPVVNGTGYLNVTFDPDIAQFVFYNGGSTWTFNAATNVWTRKNPNVEPPGGRNHVGMAYDSRNKVHILYGGRGGRDDTWAYNARTNTWTEMRPTLHPPDGIDSMLFSYDPEHNVFVLSQYRPGTSMWVYRYSNGGTPPPPPPPPPPTAPAITTQPSSKTVTAGQTATFSVTATGTAPLSYQWQKNGVNIAGATSASYTTPATTSADNGAVFRVIVSNSAGSASSNGATLTVQSSPPPGGSLPAPWQNQDLGAVGVPGHASHTGGTFDVCGSGADIWGTADAFHFVYQNLTGDGEIVARVAGLGNTDPWAKAGVMIRETLDPDSRFADLIVTPAQGASFQWRQTTGGSCGSAQTPGVTVPCWVKLVRSGDNISAFTSSNGSAWTQVGSATPVAMADPVHIGLCVTAHNNTALNCATFDSVSSSGGGPAGGPPGGGSGSSEGQEGCGALGLEAVLFLLLRISPRRRG